MVIEGFHEINNGRRIREYVGTYRCTVDKDDYHENHKDQNNAKYYMPFVVLPYYEFESLPR